MRYALLLDYVIRYQPKAILEVGTWNGERALQMLKACPTAKYYGFDLFEDATAETDSVEMNVKAHNTLSAVSWTLRGYDAKLFKGNTRETLATFRESVDFVWLDGGHSVETIRSDWFHVKHCLAPSAVVLFDDYYSDGPDTTKYGCNEIVRELSHEVLAPADPVAGGGKVQMVRVYPAALSWYNADV